MADTIRYFGRQARITLLLLLLSTLRHPLKVAGEIMMLGFPQFDCKISSGWACSRYAVCSLSATCKWYVLLSLRLRLPVTDSLPSSVHQHEDVRHSTSHMRKSEHGVLLVQAAAKELYKDVS